jgi:hypothetical protein
VRNDQIQIMSVPRCDPKVGQIPSLVYRHRSFSTRRFNL